MLEKEIVVKTRLGIHARPAAQLVKTALENPGIQIKISKNNQTADARSLSSIIALGINQGDRIVLKVEGVSEEKILKIITGFLSS